MPCALEMNDRVVANGSEKIQTITGIRKEDRKVTAGWGNTTVTDVFIQVDGESTWHGWGNFKAQEK